MTLKGFIKISIIATILWLMVGSIIGGTFNISTWDQILRSSIGGGIVVTVIVYSMIMYLDSANEPRN